MMHLKDVTVVCVDNVAVPFSELALRDTLDVIQPADVLFWNDGSAFSLGRQFTFRGESKFDACAVLWYEAPFLIETSHLLTVQWDGFALDASAWTDEYLDYDYIGAPWHWRPTGEQVGNGGFSLRSTRLMRYLAEHQSSFPYVDLEDDAICRAYRPALERVGFRFAPFELAQCFSFEHSRTMLPTFGFHGVWHWGTVLSDQQLHDRMNKNNAYAGERMIDLNYLLRMRHA